MSSVQEGHGDDLGLSGAVGVLVLCVSVCWGMSGMSLSCDVCQCLLGYVRGCQCVVVCVSVCWGMSGGVSVLWCVTVFAGVCQGVSVSCGVCQCLLGYVRRCQCLVVCVSVLWGVSGGVSVL